MAESYQIGSTLESAEDAVAVAPSDATVYAPPLSSLWVGTAGDVAVRTRAGTTVTFKSVPAGTELKVQVDKVLAATAASNIVGLIRRR